MMVVTSGIKINLAQVSHFKTYCQFVFGTRVTQNKRKGGDRKKKQTRKMKAKDVDSTHLRITVEWKHKSEKRLLFVIQSGVRCPFLISTSFRK